MRRMSHPIIIILAAAGPLLGFLAVGIRAQDTDEARIVRAIQRYEDAAQHGTAAQKEATLSALMKLLQDAEGRP